MERIREENRELKEIVQECKAREESRDGFKNNQEYYKGVVEGLKENVRDLELEIVRLRDHNLILEKEKNIYQKENEKWEGYVGELRGKIEGFLSEIGELKD